MTRPPGGILTYRQPDGSFPRTVCPDCNRERIAYSGTAPTVCEFCRRRRREEFEAGVIGGLAGLGLALAAYELCVVALWLAGVVA